MRRKLTCGRACNHTDAEHKAFDQGVEAGANGYSEMACPYTAEHLREAWKNGRSAGSFIHRGRLK